MSDYTEHGAVPVEDAVVDDPPTVEEVLARQRAEYPEQAATSVDQPDAVRTGADDASGGDA
ncbi:MAG: hypothetical protein ABW122_16870 [Ilumatobacteraceae bacterium]